MMRRSRKWCAPATAASLRRQARRAVARRQPRPVAAPKPLRTIRRGGWGIPRLSWQRLPMAALPPKGLRLKLRTLTLTTYHSLGVELLAASGLGQRRLTPRNPDLRVTSIDERGAPTPTVRPTTASRLKSSHSGPSVLCIRPRIPARGPASGDYRARPSNASVVWTRPVRRKQSRGLDRARG